MIKALLLDRDGLCVHNSKDPTSPFYYILDAQDLVLKPNVKTAFALIESLAARHRFSVILATKQRCLSKGLITPKHLDILHDQLQIQIDYWFDEIYVEPEADDKRNLFAAILKDYALDPKDALVIDDSGPECQAARDLGMNARLTNDLYAAVCQEFQIT